MRKSFYALVAVGCLIGTPAHAEICRIASTSIDYSVIARPGKLTELFSLLRAKKSEDAMQCCVACMPRVGTKVSMDKRGQASHSVTVLEGEHEGCTGEIVVDDVGQCE